MARTDKRTAAATADALQRRDEELRQMLNARRSQLLLEVKGRIRVVRSEGLQKAHESVDPDETPDADIQDDINFALIQMKAETLNKIDEALVRLDEGRYGYCFECADAISEPRLRALPFAVRCRDCEEARENTVQEQRTLAQQRKSAFLYDTIG